MLNETQSWAGSVQPMTYEPIYLDTFKQSLSMFGEKDQVRIKKKISDMLTFNPYRYIMLEGAVKVKVKFSGLRRMEIGTEGSNSGARVLYRVCEECKRNKYYLKSEEICAFCDDNMEKHVVVFDVQSRGDSYKIR